MKRALILHGTGTTPDSNWFQWLKHQLIAQGYEVWLPHLPNAHAPNTATYNNFLLSRQDFLWNQDTIIIGHSSGSVAALHLLQHLPTNTHIKAAFLVSAFTDNLNWPALDGLFIESLDYNYVKQRCPSITFVHSDNDPYCPLDHARSLAGQLEGKLVVIPGQGHFNTELGPQYQQFPKLLELIKAVQ